MRNDGMTGSSPDLDLQLPDRRLRGRWIGAAPTRHDAYAPTLVFLHEGLGSVELWRSFPAVLCARTGLRGFAFDRTGYGRSSAWPSPPGPAYMDVEGDVVLPQVLDAAGIQACLLIGHSDGGTIALDFASAQPPLLRAVVTIGAHVFNEPRTVSSIWQAREAFVTGDLRARLARYHGDNVDDAFWLWANSWLTPGFEPMNASKRLPRVRVPVLALQGEQDEYGTVGQLHAISRGVYGRCETRLMPGCGHGPHLQDEPRMVEAIARFIETLWRGPATGAARATRAVLLAIAGLVTASPVLAAQVDACTAAVDPIFAEARSDESRADDTAAAVRLRSGADQNRSCADLELAALAVEGWVEGRRLALVGGAPDQLTRIGGILTRVAEFRAMRVATSLVSQQATYAEAVSRAAVAAAQDERDEMQLYLAHARPLAESLRLAHRDPWPLPIELVEAELWLEVDRFAEARDAFARVTDPGLAARVGLGRGQVMERLDDAAEACAAYRHAAAGGLAPPATERAWLALTRLKCPR